MNVPLPSQIKIASKPASEPTPPSTKTDENASSRKMAYGKRPAHLTERPFKDNEALKALRDQLSEGSKGRTPSKNRKPRRAQRP